jgi:phosphoribosylformylglycinamidine cyclo-ligase
MNKPTSYSSAGVNIDAGNDFVDYIKNRVKQTFKPQVIGGIGGYGSLFALQGLDVDLNDAILVSSTDGVGTKIKIAQIMNDYRWIGSDLVGMCVNDLLCQGAKPLFFLDYIACGFLDNNIANIILDSIVNGCKEANLSLIGGETAEMPGVYEEGSYDLAGFAVGIVEKRHILPKIHRIHDGDLLIGLHSSGIHSNGFSLIRKIFTDHGISYHDQSYIDSKKSWGELLLTPTKIYSGICSKISHLVKGFAHITGGGLTENLPRILPDGFEAKIDTKSWNKHEIFNWIQKIGGNIQDEEMFRVFNMGIGMVIVCAEEHRSEIISVLKDEGEHFSEIGTLQRITNSNDSSEAFVTYI